MTAPIRGDRWSDIELSTLRCYYATHTLAEMMEMLPGRTYYGISTKAQQLGLKQGEEATKKQYAAAGRATSNVWQRRHCQDWTPEQVEKLRQMYPAAPMKRMIAEIGRTKKAICKKAENMGLSRDGAVVSQARRDAQQSAVRKIVEARTLRRVMSIPLEAAWRGLA